MKHLLTIVALIMSLTVSAQMLDKQEFAIGFATVKGTIKGYAAHKDKIGSEVSISVENPFTADYETYSGPIQPDGKYEVRVPMILKHKIVLLGTASPALRARIVISQGKEVVVDYNCEQFGNEVTPSFSGDNDDLNSALLGDFVLKFPYVMVIDDSKTKQVSEFSKAEYKDYILKGYKDYCKHIDTMHITQRAKELLKIDLKLQTAYCLSMSEYFIRSSYRHVNGDEMPDNKMPRFTKEFFDYPQLLDLDNIMMFYGERSGYVITDWGKCLNRFVYPFAEYDYENALFWEDAFKKLLTDEHEKQIAASIVEKAKNGDDSMTDEEEALEDKYDAELDEIFDDLVAVADKQKEAYIENFFGKGDSYFKDFLKLIDICQPFAKQTVVSDSAVREVEKMRLKFYADYVKKKNLEITGAVATEQQRGGYYEHQANENTGDSLFVELIKDFKGKVVLIDFWNTWCKPCRKALKDMTPLKNAMDGKDVVFLYVADDSSPLKEWENTKSSIKGLHYRLTSVQSKPLMDKWSFNGFPSYVIVGKDGMVKDFHTGFQGVEYYRAKIEAELKSPTPSSN